MTTTTETSAPDEDHPDTSAVTDTGASPGSDDDGTGNGSEEQPSREAARYRRQLRAAEAERDTLAATVERLQRRAIEDRAEQVHRMVRPAALWAAGTTVADVTTDTGDIDPDKLAAAVGVATESLGLTPKPRAPKPDPSQGSTTAARSPARWADALRRD